MSKTVVKVENLTKEYRLGVIGHGSLVNDFQSWWARVRKKEDPNAQIFDHERKYGDRFLALRDLSFEVKAGERLGVIGQNGAGKSTLLKILSRVTIPSNGNIMINGRVASLLEVGTGFHPELTGRENIFLNGAILGMNRAEIKKKFDVIVDFAGVEDFIDTPVKRYSSGMHVRLGFAVAAHLEPDILIVDEVLAVGDAAFQKKCIGKLEDVSNNEGRTVIFVSHNMKAVKSLCNKAILLKGGSIDYNGSVPKAVDRYIGGVHKSKSCLIEKYLIEDNRKDQVLMVQLIDEAGNPSISFEFGETVSLQIEFELRCALDGLVLCFELYSGGEKILTHYDTDQLDDPIVLREAGHYLAQVALPPILKPGLYYFENIGIEVLAITPGNQFFAKDLVDLKEKVLNFEINHPDVVNRSYLNNDSGLVLSSEKWCIRSLDQ